MENEEAKADFATSKSPPDENLTAAATPAKTEQANNSLNGTGNQVPTQEQKEPDAPVGKTQEANDADGEPAAKPKPEDDPALHAAYEQGRAARRSAIAKADAPFGEGRNLDAWLKGYDFEDEHFG